VSTAKFFEGKVMGRGGRGRGTGTCPLSKKCNCLL